GGVSVRPCTATEGVLQNSFERTNKVPLADLAIGIHDAHRQNRRIRAHLVDYPGNEGPVAEIRGKLRHRLAGRCRLALRKRADRAPVDLCITEHDLCAIEPRVLTNPCVHHCDHRPGDAVSREPRGRARGKGPLRDGSDVEGRLTVACNAYTWLRPVPLQHMVEADPPLIATRLRCYVVEQVPDVRVVVPFGRHVHGHARTRSIRPHGRRLQLLDLERESTSRRTVTQQPQETIVRIGRASNDQPVGYVPGRREPHVTATVCIRRIQAPNRPPPSRMIPYPQLALW